MNPRRKLMPVYRLASKWMLTIRTSILILLAGGVLLMTSSAYSSQSKEHMSEFSMNTDSAVLRMNNRAFRISLKCPLFSIDDQGVGGGLPTEKKEGVGSTKNIQLTYDLLPLHGSAQLEVKLFFSWSPRESILHKWASYRLVGANTHAD